MDRIISTLEEFLNEIRRSDQGRYAFRGQADKRWELDSAATRRLKEANRIQLDGPKKTGSDRLLYIYNIYHKDELIDPARRAGFDVEEGSKVYDLQLLGKLQHFGAATGLIDFTWSPLIALWFACAEQPDQNGKVFVVELSDVEEYQRVSNGQTNVDDLFPTDADRVPPLYWEPDVRSEASARILRQHSVFVLPRSHVLEEGVQGIEIESFAKEKIMKELADLGIDELSLFLDIHGFSKANGPKAPVRQMNDPFVYRLDGNRFYQHGDYEAAVKSYTRSIVASEGADIRELYYLRGNAKAANEDYEGAVEDYNAAWEATIADLESYRLRKKKT